MTPSWPSNPSPRLAQLWDQVSELASGSLLTESEASAYVAGTLPAEQLPQIERLLEETPQFAAELRRARDEFAAFFTPELRAKIEREFRRPVRHDPNAGTLSRPSFDSQPGPEVMEDAGRKSGHQF